MSHPTASSPSFHLRAAQPGDLPAIRRIILAAKINPTGLAWERFLAAVDEEDRLIGCGQVKKHADGSLELASIAVTPTWRGRGVARALITRLLAAQSQTLYLTCRAELGPFYERFGFRKINRLDMPPYFRRVQRLFSWVARWRKQTELLLVMRRAL